jgi:hypothetical protein
MDLIKLRSELDRRRVAVWRAQESTWQPIPVALTPTVVSESEWQSVVADARLVFGSFPKIMNWLLKSEQDPLLIRLLSGLTGLERLMATQDPSKFWGHVTARFDLYWHDGEIKIIEVNCTIPAMQAYSDNVLQSWLYAHGLKPASSSNVSDLLKSLLGMYREDGGSNPRPKILILHREGDSQLGELLWLQREWTKLGFETALAIPESIHHERNGWRQGAMLYDVVYRHIFAWRLPDDEIAKALQDNRAQHIYNPVSAHYEAKSFLAIVSDVADNAHRSAQVGLSEQEVSAIKRRVPWTRILGSENSSASRTKLESQLDDLVLKRSVGYGGHQVLMGRDWEQEAVQSKLRQLIGHKQHISFEHFYQWAIEIDSSLWIAQDRMTGAKRTTHVLCGEKVEEWDAWFDVSVFINSRALPVCNGGVSRIAKTPIVNIGAGGGLAPFVLK